MIPADTPSGTSHPNPTMEIPFAVAASFFLKLQPEFVFELND